MLRFCVLQAYGVVSPCPRAAATLTPVQTILSFQVGINFKRCQYYSECFYTMGLDSMRESSLEKVLEMGMTLASSRVQWYKSIHYTTAVLTFT